VDIPSIVKWYKENTDTPISGAFVRHLFDVGVLTPERDMNFLNGLMLKTADGKYVKNEYGKFVVKENRKPIIGSYPDKKATVGFRIAKQKGGKLKLVKD
jgi:hypothetical protein